MKTSVSGPGGAPDRSAMRDHGARALFCARCGHPDADWFDSEDRVVLCADCCAQVLFDRAHPGLEAANDQRQEVAHGND